MSGSGSLAWVDWAVIAGYLILSLGLGLIVARRGRKDAQSFFLSGQQLPWWLAGTSMVAYSFAADTPLVVSGWTRSGGVAKNWRWWGYMLGALLVVHLFARLWRRCRVITDVGFMELRYSGAPARGLRAFKSIYHVVFLHAFIMGWVILGMTKVIVVLFDLGAEPPIEILGMFAISVEWTVMLACALVALIYSEVTGLWGVVVTDFLQFGVALLGAVVLCWIVLGEMGGLQPMLDALAAEPATAGKTSLAPDVGESDFLSPLGWTAALVQFLVLVLVVPFANKNADGSGVMVQRLLAAKNESHAIGATLWFAVAHYAIRPWPWILVGLASLVVFPDAQLFAPDAGEIVAVSGEAIGLDAGGQLLQVPIPDTGAADWIAQPQVEVGQYVQAGELLAATDDERAYPLMMRKFLPIGMLGLVVASFLAAFMSTIDTHVNLASSYIVNDLYVRFLRPKASSREQMRVAAITGPLVLVLAIIFARSGDSVRGMFDVFTSLFSGVGLVYIARWLWWRINAWSEITALLASGAGTIVLRVWPEVGVAVLPEQLLTPEGLPAFSGQMLLVAGFSTLLVIPITLLTPPVDRAVLQPFFDQVRPPGFWAPVGGQLPSLTFFLRGTLRWMCSVTLVLAALLAPGDLLLADGDHFQTWLILMALAGGLLILLRPRRHAAGQP